ncbi:hypothetical protein [Streptacidiphilus sp. EB129]|uniref:hypothetical protein n=1 Tax=Streptacidiphilus sp. EB129 TaxID=3156262 RepID=UPI003513BA16
MELKRLETKVDAVRADVSVVREDVAVLTRSFDLMEHRIGANHQTAMGRLNQLESTMDEQFGQVNERLDRLEGEVRSGNAAIIELLSNLAGQRPE